MPSQTLSRLYASSGDDVLIHTLEIVYGSFRVRVAQSFEDVTAVLDGATVVYRACAMELSLPPSDSEGTQSLQFTVCNIDGTVQQYMREVADWYSGDGDGAFPYLIYRGYISSDLNTVAAGPYEFYVNSVACNSRSATITGTYADVLNTSWPRGRYKSTDWPGLIYAS
ncbi:TPA: DUF1833 family protein [Escherichia coli]|nr:DUF1833 family protein [Escherichia coli]HEL8044763.1 DUF1833 family protein [Escherichia coli]HEL8059161.1 DUF1833 family protein [Escherichia coli]HEL8103563.1 DUF1833 family protein [Escherichia coli]HEL8126460.1 DUF1833 family protein [Escherichia coli]